MFSFIIFMLVFMSGFEIHGMENTARTRLEKNNSPVFIKKVTNHSCQMVKMLKSHFFGFVAESEKEPIITLEPGQAYEWKPLLAMPYSSVHFLAQLHAVTITAQGGYEDFPNSHTFNTCLLTYFKPDLIQTKLLKDHVYTLEIVLADRKTDGHVEFEEVTISENLLHNS